MNNNSMHPCAELRAVLQSAYDPCRGFQSTCTSIAGKHMRWSPADGHVPRGFCGALGDLADVELVLIVAEPGDPQANESYSPCQPKKKLLEEVSENGYRHLESGNDQYYKNIRCILRQCWPDITFAEQMKRTWITESTLCSAVRETRTVPAAISRYCVESYLEKQLSFLCHATIATLGEKAKNRTVHLEPVLGKKFINAYAAAPPGCNHPNARPSWDRIAKEVREPLQTARRPFLS
jgi:hypothetical protein